MREIKVILASLCLLIGATAMANGQASESFCQTKTDYDATVTCSDENVLVRNNIELYSYLANFGLSNGKYKNLSIGFSLSGERRVIHSPCRILTRRELVHTANEVCLDGRKGVQIAANSVITAQKLHILSPEGDTIFHRSTSIHANELEILSSGKIHLNTGGSLTIINDARLVSTYDGSSFTPIVFGLGSRISAANVSITGSGKINFSGHFVKASNDLDIETVGNASSNRVNIAENTVLQASDLSIKGGNRFTAKKKYCPQGLGQPSCGGRWLSN